MTSAPTDLSPIRSEVLRRLIVERHATGPQGGDPMAADSSSGPPLERRQRAQADRLVRGVLRQKSLLDAQLGRGHFFNPRNTPQPVRWILRLAVYEKIFQTQAPDYAIGQQAVELARRTKGERAGAFVNAVLRRLLPTLPGSPESMRAEPFWGELSRWERLSVPEEIIQALKDGYGEAAGGEVVEALAEAEAPVWLRANSLRTDPGRCAEALAAEGVQTALGVPATEALRWEGGESLPWNTEAWGRGELTVQDIGAMLAAPLLDPAPGSNVLDLCAAPGGKTGHLWERMEGRGRLVGLEIDPRRRRELRRSLVRLYGPGHGTTQGIEIPDCDRVADFEPGAGGWDRVLIDAPCQALGLIGRHPEIRWDRRLRFRDQMRQVQRHLLDDGTRFVRPGGRLLWVTCSPTRGENEEVVGSWLRSKPQWRLVDLQPLVGGAWAEAVQIDEGVVRTRPDRVTCDGFAMILIERQKSS